MTTIKKLRTLARELAGEAWDYDRRRLPAEPAAILGTACGRVSSVPRGQAPSRDCLPAMRPKPSVGCLRRKLAGHRRGCARVGESRIEVRAADP